MRPKERWVNGGGHPPGYGPVNSKPNRLPSCQQPRSRNVKKCILASPAWTPSWMHIPPSAIWSAATSRLCLHAYRVRVGGSVGLPGGVAWGAVRGVCDVAHVAIGAAKGSNPQWFDPCIFTSPRDVPFWVTPPTSRSSPHFKKEG